MARFSWYCSWGAPDSQALAEMRLHGREEGETVCQGYSGESGARVSPTKIEWPTTYPRLTHDKQKPTVHESVELEAAEPQVPTHPPTHPGPSAAGRINTAVHLRRPTQSSLVLSTLDPPTAPLIFLIHNLVPLPLRSLAIVSSRSLKPHPLHLILPSKPSLNTPRSTVTMVSLGSGKHDANSH
jgi:hypothetical protein